MMMQRIVKYMLLAVTVAATGLQGCSDSYFDELIQNPNQVTNATLPSLLSTTTYKSGINSYTAATITNPYVQYTANPSAGASSDTYQTINFTSAWDDFYFAMADATEMKKLAIAQNSGEYLGVANVLIAYNLSLVNDLWGSAPFSKAFNPANITPAYDSDQEVYNQSLALINEAIVELEKTTTTIKLPVGATGGDLIYFGDKAKWLKFAYALKARLLNKVSKTPAYNANAVLAAVSNSFKSNADDAGMATFAVRNNWAGVALSNANQSLGGWLSEQLIDQLKGVTYGVEDPRLKKITDPTVNNTYIGTVNGAGNRPPGANTTKDENYISGNSPWTSTTAPLLIATYAEIKFIEAEAALRAGERPRAYDAYRDGIRANMTKFQVAPSDQDLYVNNPLVSVGAANLTLGHIFREKFIATYLNPEAWNDARRFDYAYKDFTLPVNAVLTTYIRRLDYPLGEANKNSANVPPPVPRTERLWWDK